jgi:5'-3' exonuclease
MQNKPVNPTNSTNPIYIFIDGSYFCFYRYFALMNWWKNAFPDEPLDDPIQNPKFVEKFKKTFIETLQKIPKNLNIEPKKVRKSTKNNNSVEPIEENNKPIFIVGKDCKRENIWRNNFYDKYKASRANGQEDGFMGGPFFKMVYEESLFQQGGASLILQHPCLEADDCIAISVKHLIQTQPNCFIYIITSDNDYLQLIRDNVHIYNLTFKNLKDSKIFTGNPEKDLKLKIIMGDGSDNIPSVFPKCGIKTAYKCIEDPEFFKKKMCDNMAYYEQYLLNDTLISFDKIPVELIDEFMKEFGVLLET